MKKRTITYRLFALFTAVIMAVSISLPSVLLAMEHCDMDTQPFATASSADEHCPMLSDYPTHNHSEKKHGNHDDQHSDCDLNFSCDCSFDKLQIKADAIPSVNKTAKAFVVSVVQYLDIGPTSTPTFIVDAEFSLNTHSPPIFLLNSVFLN